MYSDLLVKRRGDVSAYVVGSDRKLPVPSVYEHRQLYAAGPSEIIERVHRCAHCASGVQHVVNQYDRPSLDGNGDARRPHDRPSPPAQIVAIQPNVQLAYGRSRPLKLLYEVCCPLGQGDSSGMNAHNDNLGITNVAFENFMCDADEGTAYLLAIENLSSTNRRCFSRGV